MRQRLLSGLLSLAALPALAGTELIEDVPPAPTANTSAGKASRTASFVQSTLQVGCEGVASRACRRASIDVEVGPITRINEASGGTAIQETLIGTAR
ncbi:MAG: hypothetical protein KDG55_14375 [Rhodocyclaceae bacterium]|nr:hypothetical protein [Rhodocyclaceae bacterium]